MLSLDSRTKNIIESHTGLSIGAISQMGYEDIEKHLMDKKGKNIKTKINNDKRRIGRGSVYLNLGRLVGLKKIDKALAKIK